MFKTVLAFFAAAFFLSSSAIAADQKLQDLIAATAQINKNCSSTVIYSKRDDKTGDVKTILLTAKHCIDSDKSQVVVEFPVYQNNRVVARKEYVGKVHGKYYKADLALIELLDKDTYFEKVSKIAPAELTQQMGDPTWTLGYPLGMALTVTQGTFGGLETIDWPTDGSEYLRATPMIAPGNSGGAVYVKNEKGEYEIAGVTTAAVGLLSFIGFYTPSYQIHEYLKIALTEAVVEEKKEESKKGQ